MKYVPVVPREYWPELRGQVGAVAVAEPAAEDTDYIVVDIVAVVEVRFCCLLRLVVLLWCVKNYWMRIM